MLSRVNLGSSVSLVISDPAFPSFRVVRKCNRWFAQKRWMGVWWNVGAFSEMGYASIADAQWVMYKEANRV